MNIKNFLASLGAAALVLNSAAPAAAQVVPGNTNPAQTYAPAPMQSYAPARQQGGPQFVLQQNSLDEHGRPRPMRIEDAIRTYGPQGAQMLIEDDRKFCVMLADFSAADARIRAAEQELRLAEEDLARAESAEERRLAERRRNRARLNLLDILLGVVGVGAGILTGGLSTVAGIGYGTMVASNQGQSLIRMKNSDADSRMWYRWMQNYAERMKLYDGRLQLYDMRMQLHSFRGSFWDATMSRYCNEHVRPYAVTYAPDSGPDAIMAPGTVLRWQTQ